jgi:hypothetical protein
MNDDSTVLDPSGEDILSCEVSDEALEAAADMETVGPTNYQPTSSCARC